MANVFDWKRFWCPRGGIFNLADGGFLSDPETSWGKLLNPELVTFGELSEVRCLALLGEPGIGKTWALERDGVAAEEAIAREGGKVMRLDLRSFGSEDRLVKTLFEAPEWQEWRSRDYHLHLFLDSLDECLLRIDNVASLLSDELPKQPVERLLLRIACRTAPWPAILENSLKGLYGADGFKAYELVPLRRIDVEHAAAQSGIKNVDGFLTCVKALDVVSLAIKPVTLRFLINTYLKEHDLPSNQIDLYEAGCRALCEEPNESRRGSGRAGTLSADERLDIASRIAGITQFANRYAIWTGNETDAQFSEDVLARDVCGGVENGPDGVTVSSDAIREVLDTGLFSSRGADRMGWAHQTYAEFLAARYCKIHAMPAQQIQSLLFHPEGQGIRLIPQLYELAGWISVTNEQIFDIFATSYPEALLGAAAASLSDKQRGIVVESLLNQCDAGRRLDLQPHMFQLYRKLGHSGLQAQLRPYLRDRTKLSPTRCVAMNIAHACEVAGLASDLADIALDISEDRPLRIRAAAAVAIIGPAESRRRLRSLATGEAGDDPDDEMKGCGLMAVWPEFISASEAFGLITAPKQSNFFGVYTRFLYEKFIEKMVPGDLPAALEWFSSQPARHHEHSPVDRLMDRIVQQAWENLDHPGVTEALAAAVLSRIRLHDGLFSSLQTSDIGKQMETNSEHRRRLLGAVFPQLTVPGAGRLAIWGAPLLVPADFEWMLERILSGNLQASAPVEARLLRFLADTRKPEQMRALWYACRANPIIASECEALFGPVDLNSEEVRLLRENLRQEGATARPKPLDPPPSQLIEKDLQNIEGGDAAAWLRLTLDMGLEPTSTHYSYDLVASLTETPGWKAADQITRNRLVDAAERYVNEGDPQNAQWFGTPNTPYTATSGVRALTLLLNTAEAKLQNISIDSWRKWVPALLSYSFGGSSGEQLQSRLLHLAYSHVPQEVINRVLQLIDSENERSGLFLVASEIERCWDDGMAQPLLEKARDPRLKQHVVGDLIGLLIRHGVAESVDLAESFLRPPYPESPPERSRMLGAIQALVRNTPDAGWPKVWAVINESDELGRSVIESTTYADPSHASFIGKLNESQLAELYLWMVRHYPYADGRAMFGIMGPADTAVILRDSILEHLKKRGTFAACAALRRIMEELPQYTWLRHHVDEAELLARAATWEPISAREFLALALDGTKRFVETGSQLAEAVLESLARLDVKFHDALPAARDLWNDKDGVFWPKDEQEMSNYVARHLREDLRDRGVIINREVQIRRGIGDRSGQSTDIHVDAAVPGASPHSYERVSVITEAKGNWNPELLSAMGIQLRDRYLKENRCRDGIYMVGWFSCTKWSDEDHRKRRRSRMSLEEAKAFFRKQAIDLSNTDYNLRSYVLDISLR
jgi:hypothetical protein